MENKSIGGFIGWELGAEKGSWHPQALALANGRACFNLLLAEYSPSVVYIPYYTCNALLEPLLLNKTSYQFYSIDKELNPEFNKTIIGEKEYFLYVNYFDIKNDTVQELEQQFGDRLIVDNTQAFFNKSYANAISFNSCRKFFGCPDGGYLYTKKRINKVFEPNTDYKADFLLSRLEGKQEIAYQQFLENEKILGAGIRGISMLSDNILHTIDYDICKTRRLENFHFLHSLLSEFNQFQINMTSVGVPHYYPFIPYKPIEHKLLIAEKLFIPTLWTDVLYRNLSGFETEKYITKNLLPLPIDHRYGEKEMNEIVEKIKQKIEYV